MKTINSFRSKFFALVLAFVASVSSFAKDGYPDFQVDELYYNFLEGDSVQVTFLMPPTIPTEVAADTSNKKNVSGAGYVHLTEIVIPSTVIYEDKTYHVTRIGHGAFMYCPNLMHINLPTSIKSIGEAAFHSCRYLSSITLNEGLESIEQQAFGDCSTLKEVSLPSTLKSLKQNVFYDSKALSKVICKALVPPIVEKDLLTGTDNYNASIIPNATLYVPASSLTTYQNTYPWNTFGQILSIEDSLQNIFPTLTGLQRTSCTKTIGEDEYGTVWGSRSYLMQEIETATIDGKQYLLFGIDNNYDKLYPKLWLREENNKILLYSTAQKKDLVLYDFTLNVGDSLPRLYVDYDLSSVVDYDNDEWGLSPLVVTEVSTITLLDGKEYKKWTFDNGMQYVEGIGSFGTCYAHNDFYQLIANAPLTSDVYSQHLVCVSKNGQLLYKMDDAEMEQLETECLCEYNNGPKKDNAKEGKIGGRPTPTQWNMLELDLREMENGNTIVRAETFSYTLENDSIVTNGKTFYQLARQSTKDTAITKSFVGALHFGEDEDNRVYFFRDGQEYVLYDFTAEPGDTLEIFAGINNYPQYSTYTHIVTGKDTIENGACRMLLQVIFPDETTTAANVEKIWLAGLGSVDGIVHNAAKQTSDAHAAPSRSARSGDTQASIMLCAWREDSCLYTTDHPDYDTFGCVYNQDPTAVETILAPQSSYRKFIRDGQLFILHNGTMYNVIGLEMK